MLNASYKFFFTNGLVLLKDIKDYILYGIDLLTPQDQRKAILPYKDEF
jgi:hypothetical protein